MPSLNFDEVLLKYRYVILLVLGGVILTGIGFFYYKNGGLGQTKVEVLDDSSTPLTGTLIVVEIEGQVEKPGVYKLENGSRIDDLLIAAGGLSGDADRSWTDKYLNRAAKISDGQKLYIPKVGEQTLGTSANSGGVDQNISTNISSDSSGKININSATLGELDKLPGIGPVYGQSIVDHRPYSTTEEMVSKGAIRQSVYDKIKDLVVVY